MAATDTTRDVTEILTADHREMIELLDQIEATTDPAERRALADAVTAEVMRHSVAEEMFTSRGHLYPSVDRTRGVGELRATGDRVP